MMKQVRLFLGLWVMGIGVWLWTGWPVAASESQPVEKKVLWGKGCSLVAQGAELGEASCRYGYDNLGRDVVEVEGEGGGLEEEMKIWLGIEVAYGAGDWDEVARLWGRLSPRGRVTPSAELLGRELWWRANGARRAAAPLPVRSEREWVAYMTTLEAEAAAQDMVVASEVAQVRRLGLWHDEVGWQEVEGAEGALGRSQGLTTTLTVGDGCQYNNLQLAINGANSGDDIWVGRPVGGGAWTGAAATANIDGKTLTIIGGYNVGCTSRTGYTTLNANGVTDTVLEMGTTSGVGTDEVRLRNFNLINAEGDIDFGGGLQIESGYTVILDDTWVYGNTADKGGGAYIDNGYLILQNNSRLHSNTAAGNGGGVFCTGGGTVRLRTGSDIGGAMGDGNIAGGSGGGIAADNCNVYIGDGSAGVSVSYNEGGFGGGIYGINGSQIILQYQPTLVGNNTGRTAGGGFYLSSGSKLYVDSGRIVQNVASSSGGGIYGTGVGTLIDFDLGTVGTHCVTPANQCLLLEQNQATNTYGGGFYLGSGATADIEAAYIQQNIGGIAASAFYATGSGTVINMRSSMIIDNYFLSQQEYVIRLFSGAEANLSGTTIAGNWNLAGAILGVASTFNGNGLIIYSNTATGLVNGTATINNSFLQYAHAGTNNQQTSPNLGILYHLPYYSPAVDYYNDTIMVDIDGESRPVSSLHDAGADEITPRVGVDGAACAYGTVGSALAAASDGSTVYISAGFYDERIGSINKDIHFVAATADCTGADSGATSSSVVIDANHQSALYGGVAELTTGRSVTFTNISLRDGEASYGGVLYIPTGSRVLLDDSDVSQGVATVVGGGVRLFRGTLVLSGTSRIYNNEALGGNGGGIAAQLGTIVLQDESQVGTEVLGNVAVNGGGIYMVTSWLTMTAESGIVGNEATENGGGLYGATGSQIYVAGRIEGNGATGVVGRGGGVYLLPDSGTPISMIVSAGVIVSNTAGFGGGGVAVVADNSQANIRLNQSDLISNTALLGGGAWLMDADSTLVMAGNSKVSYNRATSGNGGGVFLGGGALTFGGQVVNNEASSNGGGIFNSGGVVTIGEFSSLNGNWAGNDGGGIYDSSGNVLLLDGVDSYAEILWNRADNDGGGVYMNGGDLQVHGYVLIGSNRASSNGGGVYQVGGVGDWEAVDDEQRPLLIGNWTETGNGGGLYTINMTDTTNYLSGVVIRHNEAGRSGSGLGGGIYGQESIYKVAYTQLISNVATYGGGGMALEVSSWVEFRSTSNGNVCSPLALPRNEHCSMFKDNRADQVGGAVFVDRESSFTSSQVGFRDNRAGIGAVAASWIYGQNVLGFTNALMMNNVAWSPSYSDVIRFAGDTGILALRHTTIAGNGSPAVRVDLAGPSVQIDNSIVWDNVDGVLVAGTLSSPTCNIVQNGVGGTVINPSFVSRWYGDYQLGVGSPALDVCVNEGTFVDLLGMPRPQAGGYDMGAFERCDTTITAVGLVGNDVVIDWVEDELVYAVYHSSVSPYLGMTALGFDEAPPYTDVGRLSGGAEGHYYYVDGLNCYRSQYFGTFSFEVTAGS